jgi:hypothetical protein
MTPAHFVKIHTSHLREAHTKGMENIYVRDYEELLSGNLFAPMRLDRNYDEVDADFEGEVFLQERRHRIVYITGGDFARAYGGPEEGGWWYDRFDPEIEFVLTVRDENTLRQAISHVEALLWLRHPDSEARDLGIFISARGFHEPGRPHYE